MNDGEFIIRGDDICCCSSSIDEYTDDEKESFGTDCTVYKDKYHAE